MLTFDPDHGSKTSLDSANLHQDLQPMRPLRPQSKPPQQPYNPAYNMGSRQSASSLGSTDVGPSGIPNVSMSPAGAAYPNGGMPRSQSYDNNLNSIEPYPDLLKPSNKSKSYDNNMHNVGLSLPPQNGYPRYSDPMGGAAPGRGAPVYHTSHPSLAGSGDLGSTTPIDLSLRAPTPDTSRPATQSWPPPPPPPSRPPPGLPPGMETTQAFDNIAMADEEGKGQGDAPGGRSSSSPETADPRESVHSQYTSTYPVFTNAGFGTDTIV